MAGPAHHLFHQMDKLKGYDILRGNLGRAELNPGLHHNVPQGQENVASASETSSLAKGPTALHGNGPAALFSLDTPLHPIPVPARLADLRPLLNPHNSYLRYPFDRPSVDPSIWQEEWGLQSDGRDPLLERSKGCISSVFREIVTSSLALAINDVSERVRTILRQWQEEDQIDTSFFEDLSREKIDERTKDLSVDFSHFLRELTRLARTLEIRRQSYSAVAESSPDKEMPVGELALLEEGARRAWERVEMAYASVNASVFDLSESLESIGLGSAALHAGQMIEAAISLYRLSEERFLAIGRESEEKRYSAEQTFLEELEIMAACSPRYDHHEINNLRHSLAEFSRALMTQRDFALLDPNWQTPRSLALKASSPQTHLYAEMRAVFDGISDGLDENTRGDVGAFREVFLEYLTGMMAASERLVRLAKALR